METPDKDFIALTIKANGIANVIKCKVGISSPGSRNILEIVAIWDTGASMSVITEAKARELGLIPSAKINVSNTSGTELRDAYIINLYLPSKVKIEYLKVGDVSSLLGADMLIGMDVIAMGDFSVTNSDGKTTASYRIPSIKEIDYVVEAREISHSKHMQAKLHSSKEKRESNDFKRKVKKRREKVKKKRKQAKRQHRNK